MNKEIMKFSILPDGSETFIDCTFEDDISAESLLISAGMILTTTYAHLAQDAKEDIKEGALWVKKELTKAMLSDEFWDGNPSVLPACDANDDATDHFVNFSIFKEDEKMSVVCESGEKMTYMDLLYALASMLLYVYDLLMDDEDESWNTLGDLFAESFANAAENEAFWNNKTNIIEIANSVYTIWEKADQKS